MTEQQEKDFKIINGNSLEVLDTLEENSIDAIVTDPPYELGFMGKSWDASGIAYNVELWKKALRVLKPGGHLLAFGGSRTYHRICCAIEDAGFEIRDCIMWLYGSGFPKSMNIGLAIDKKNGIESIEKAKNEWAGWGTCLKPAYEPIVVARKPVAGTIVDNVIEYGVGGLNIDECRIDTTDVRGGGYSNRSEGVQGTLGWITQKKEFTDGRFPANVILTYDNTDEKEVCGGFPYTKSTGGSGEASKINTFKNVKMAANETNTGAHLGGLGDEGSAARYFYCAKASSKDRDEGLEVIEKDSNIHPTVKPVDLMQYLVRLVTPKGGTVLDIFNGSGSTGKAVAFENREREANYKYIGIELDPEYCEISRARIDYALNKYEYEAIKEKKENEAKGQLDLFDFDWGSGEI